MILHFTFIFMVMAPIYSIIFLNIIFFNIFDYVVQYDIIIEKPTIKT